jgi:hypothetical protein
MTALVGAGCGGDDDGGGDAVPAEDFAEEVNALCQERDAKAEAVFEELFNAESEEPSADQIHDVVEQFLPIARDYRDGVAEAGPPEGFEDEYEEYLDLMDELIDDLEEAVDDPAKAQELFDQEDDPRMADLERKMGLDDCADSSA